MKFISNFYNPLLKRHDIVAKKSFTSNPGFAAVKEDIAKHFNKAVDCVVVRTVKGSFGSSEFVIEASVYDSAELLQSTEPKPRVKKEGAK